MAGIGLPSIWENLKNQVFLGTEKFVDKNQKAVNKKETLDEVPQLQKRKLPELIEYYEKQYKSQEEAIVQAYLSGGYTLKALGEYFGRHYSTISRDSEE